MMIMSWFIVAQNGGKMFLYLLHFNHYCWPIQHVKAASFVYGLWHQDQSAVVTILYYCRYFVILGCFFNKCFEIIYHIGHRFSFSVLTKTVTVFFICIAKVLTMLCSAKKKPTVYNEQNYIWQYI